jgi:hypothetical protein
MPDLKPITRAGIPAALQKANRYRLLNDSLAAESICLDVLAVDPDNNEAIVTHVLSITDQFPGAPGDALARAQAAAGRLRDPYAHAYYQGIIGERWAKALRERDVPDAGALAYEWVTRALDWYAKAESLRPEGNDEAILRWNTCVRMLQRDASLHPREAEDYVPVLDD